MKADQSDPRFLETDYIYRYTKPSVGGTGSASTLPMTQEDCEKVQKHALGFTTPAPKPKRRKRA